MTETLALVDSIHGFVSTIVVLPVASFVIAGLGVAVAAWFTLVIARGK